MAKLYDLMLLVDPNAPEPRQAEVLQEVRSMIESGGTIASAHEWGTRKLAFEIDHRPEAAYHLIQFEGSNELLERLRNSLKIMDGVLRFRMIRVKPGTAEPPRPDPARAPRREEEEDEEGGRVAARAAADAPPER